MYTAYRRHVQSVHPMAAARSTQRSYLSASERRGQLLDAALAMVERGGWTALTMTGVAAEAGVSRQLVYDRFGDLQGLSTELLQHLFHRVRTATEEVIQRDRRKPVSVRSGQGALAETVQEAHRVFLALPRGDRRLLRAIATDTGTLPPELSTMRVRIREDLTTLWLAYVQARSGQPERIARAAVWAAINATWALTELVDDGELGVDEAAELVAALATTGPVRKSRRRS